MVNLLWEGCIWHSRKLRIIPFPFSMNKHSVETGWCLGPDPHHLHWLVIHKWCPTVTQIQKVGSQQANGIDSAISRLHIFILNCGILKSVEAEMIALCGRISNSLYWRVKFRTRCERVKMARNSPLTAESNCREEKQEEKRNQPNSFFCLVY